VKAGAVPQSDKAKILAAFSNLTDGAAPFDEKQVCHYMIQPLVELYVGCMAVLKVSWCGIIAPPQILADLPPSLSTDISFFLYGPSMTVLTIAECVHQAAITPYQI
jgi:hypothetical protein